MGDNNRRNKGTERNYDHTDHFRAYLLKELLEIYKDEACHHRRDDLALITDHLNLEESEIPYRNLVSRCGRYAEAVQELGRHKRQSKDDTKNLSRSHFLCDRPYDTYRQQMEYRFTDQPEEIVHS